MISIRPVPMNLTGREKGLYLREIKRDIAYFSRSFCRAHMSVDITGCSPDEASRKVREALILALLKDPSEALEQCLEAGAKQPFESPLALKPHVRREPVELCDMRENHRP